ELLDVGVLAPEPNELLEIAVPLRLLPRHGTVDRDLVSSDVLQDPIVGRWRPSHIVLRLEPIDRDDNLQAPQAGPLDRNRPHRARDELRMDALRRKLRQ